jgi:hypothetical protein
VPLPLDRQFQRFRKASAAFDALIDMPLESYHRLWANRITQSRGSAALTVLRLTA